MDLFSVVKRQDLPNECLRPTRLTPAVSIGSWRCLLSAASSVPLSVARRAAEALGQVQGRMAEYERAKLLERSRRGKRHKAQAGSVKVLGGAPLGYR
jgi:hypothetical protein